MNLAGKALIPRNEWSFQDWKNLDSRIREQVSQYPDEEKIWRVLVKAARRVMRNYTTSFFIVSRFLPAEKRAQVEAIYAAVRYPDEITDSFRLPADKKLRLLDEWRAFYEIGISAASLREALDLNVPAFLAPFTKVVRDNSIPADYYRSFLDSMRADVNPRVYSTLEDLIDNYVYGSAVVVGYFLAYVYGTETIEDFPRATRSARALGIALQLTNFLRDVSEDQKRGRTYLPADLLGQAGIENPDVHDKSQHVALAGVIRQLCVVAEEYYAIASADLDAFSRDCRPAINSCILVYRRLNERIAGSRLTFEHRESVPLKEKFQVLPTSKYWRIPVAYLVR